MWIVLNVNAIKRNGSIYTHVCLFLNFQGLYFHVAIYDEETGYIYIHGGMSFYDDDIKPSNQTYAFKPGKQSVDPVWNYVEQHPDDQVSLSYVTKLFCAVVQLLCLSGDIFACISFEFECTK